MDIPLPHITGEGMQQVGQIVAYLRLLALRLQELPEPGEKGQEAPVMPRSHVFPTLQVQGSLNGVYMRLLPVRDTGEIRIRTGLTGSNGATINRQSFFLWGNLGNRPVQGFILADTGGSCTWEGTEGITLFTEGGGILGIRLTEKQSDPLVLQSAKPFSLLE